MTNKKILILVFVVAFLTLLAGCLTEPNQRPIITSDPVETATVGVLYTYDVDATDPDEDTLTYFLTKKPSGMFINSATGLIKWTPIPVQIGDNSVIVTVSDGSLNITQPFTVKVSKTTPTPIPVKLTKIVVDPKTMSLIVGGSKIITLVTAHYSDGSTAGIALGSCAYASSATNIAKVSNGVVTAIAKGTATITVGYGGRFDTVVVTVSKPIPDNQAPIINSVPSLTATVGVKYTYTIKATDPDGDSITYSLIYPPTGMTFDGIATISWIPAEVQIGYFDVTVKASDGILSDTQSFTITVSELPAVNHPPIITSTPGNTAIVDELYTYEIEATDPDGDVLTYSLITKPEGMTITSNIVSWTPTEGQIGYHDFVIKVSDGQLFTTRGSYIMVRELWLELTGITVEPKTMDLIVGDTDTIDSVTAAYEFRGYEDPVDLRDCTFLTSDSEVATVEKVVGYVEDILITTVTVTAEGGGTANILVNYMGKFDTIEVTVTLPIITIDGILSLGEWDDATEIPIAGDMGTVWVLADVDYLYVAFNIDDSTDAREDENEKGNDQTSININPTPGAEWGKPIGIVFQTGADPDAFTTPDPDIPDSSGNTDGYFTEWCIDGVQLDLPIDLDTMTIYNGTRVSEWKVPLVSIAPSVGNILPIGGAIDVGDGNSYRYPSNLEWEDLSTYIDIVVY